MEQAENQQLVLVRQDEKKVLAVGTKVTLLHETGDMVLIEKDGMQDFMPRSCFRTMEEIDLSDGLMAIMADIETVREYAVAQKRASIVQSIDTIRHMINELTVVLTEEVDDSSSPESN